MEILERYTDVENRCYERDVMNRLYGFFIGTFMIAGFAALILYLLKEEMEHGLRKPSEH